MSRRNHLDDFTRVRRIGKLEERRTVTNVAAEFESTKVSFRALGKRSKPQMKRGRDGSQQASLLSNSPQQRGDKCRGLLWPDAFTKGTYSPAVLNAAFR
ncbi:uncharacterized protein TNCV_59631 [Trichonephila clavipes]|nr:uncharacterized protein TNCV_59631 [Trichonephila clavipes]